MEIQNKISEQVFDKIRSKFKHITLGDSEGNSTTDPEEAAFFNFNYTTADGADHGNVTISLIDKVMKIYYSKNITAELEGSELSWWYELLKDLRKTAMANLYGFDTHDISRASVNINDIKQVVDQGMNESKMYGTTKSSYQECGPAKIIVRHKQRVNDEVRGARSRQIESLFVESHEGERFKMPFNSLPGARAIARHVSQGGKPYDDMGLAIAEMVDDVAKLRPFVARNRNAVFEDETTMQMIEAAKEYYTETRATIGKLKGKRGYKAWVENFQAVTEDDSYDAESMKDRFTKKTFSGTMEAAMPVVSKAFDRKFGKTRKPTNPMNAEMKPIKEFEEWVEETGSINIEQPEQVTEGLDDSLADYIGLSADEIKAVQAIADGEEELIWGSVICDKLYGYYHDQMPRDADPIMWMESELEREYGNSIEEASPMDMLRGLAGKLKPKSDMDRIKELPWSENHAFDAGHDAGWMDEGETNPYDPAEPEYARWEEGYAMGIEDREEYLSEPVKEAKSGPFKSKAIGSRVQVVTADDFGNDEHIGKVGTITRAEREHTFSSLRPWVIIYKVEFDDGAHVWIRREGTKAVKEQMNEGTWAIPKTPEQKERLKALMAEPLEFGVDAQNATGAMYDLIGDDELFDQLYADSQELGPEADARPTIKKFMSQFAQLNNLWLGEDMINEDWGSSDWYPVMRQIYRAIRRNGGMFDPEMIEREAEDAAEFYGDMMGYDRMEDARDAIISHFVRTYRHANVERYTKGDDPSLYEDRIMPKATYKDYMDAYKSSDIGGTDVDDDAKRMVKHVEKKGKEGCEKMARSALKRMSEKKQIADAPIQEEIDELRKFAGLK